MNLGRVRELMATPVEERYVLVNVPAFQLEAVEKYEVQQRHRVIVGRTERQTPSVKATIRALNFFPYWRVPDSVAHLDLIPRLMKEPEYLQNEKIRVLDPAGNREVDPQTVDWNSPEAQEAQVPSGSRAAERVGSGAHRHAQRAHRLHARHADEAAVQAALARLQRRLRARRGRVRSGRLAGQLRAGLGEPGRAQQIVEGGQAVDVNLTRPVPVYFVYITAWAERDGDVEFRPDIYGRDGDVDQIAEMDRDPNEPAPAVTLAP